MLDETESVEALATETPATDQSQHPAAFTDLISILAPSFSKPAAFRLAAKAEHVSRQYAWRFEQYTV